MPRRKYVIPTVALQERALKRQLCEQLARAMLRTGRPQRHFAREFGTSIAVISLIYNYRTEKISFNQLIRFFACLYPHLKILVAP